MQLEKDGKKGDKMVDYKEDVEEAFRDLILQEELGKEPVIEELYYEDVVKDINSQRPKVIVLKKGKLLKECLDCGYRTQVLIRQDYCPNFNCKSKNIEVINVEELNEENLKKWKELKKRLPHMLEWASKDVKKVEDIVTDRD